MLMMLHIEWETGHMGVDCEAFFPAPQNKLKVLLKTIDLDWKHKEEILNQMMQFLKDLEADAEQHKEEIKKQFQTEYQKMCDLKSWTESGKYSNGVPIPKVELKQLKSDLKHQKVVVNGLEQNFKRYSKRVQKAKVNQEIIAQKM
jgi:hypothetical protein